jgi:hypothetical protein
MAKKLGATLFAPFACACAAIPAHTSLEQPQCSLATFPTNPRIGSWSVDKFAGQYVDEIRSLTVRREGQRLLVTGWILGTRELATQNVESWTWTDGCGVRYAFVLPSDGPGAWLTVTMTDGSSTSWHR